MKERSDRLKAIKKLIKNNRVESQDELLKGLTKEGFDVTQATLSRDLKLLKVGKVSDGHAGYVYTLQSDEDRGESEQIFVQDFLRGYVSIDWNATTVVIKTFGGHADAVANALDCLKHTDTLNEVEILFHHSVQTWNLVQILLPDKLSTKHTVGHLLCIARSPKIFQQIHDLLIVVWYDLYTVLALATLIVGDDGSQTEYQALGQFTLAVEIGLYSGQVTSLELRE